MTRLRLLCLFVLVLALGIGGSASADEVEEAHIPSYGQQALDAIRAGEDPRPSLDELNATALDETVSYPCRLYADHALATLSILAVLARYTDNTVVNGIANELVVERGVYQGFCLLAPMSV